ncbi:MAG: hypothetical protein MR919_05595, partial [Parabacteroides sp.]|nr:hypothetical protein [Parabacteroides sp.]
EDKRQAHPIFGQISKNTAIIFVYMGKIKGFLFAVRHREILMTDLGLYVAVREQARKAISNVFPFGNKQERTFLTYSRSGTSRKGYF